MNKNGQRFYTTRIDLDLDRRSQIVEILNQSLATTTDLKTQVKQAHWNVKGMNFYQLHQLFDEIASDLEAYIDLIAERVTALGGVAMGTVRIAAARSLLREYSYDITEGKDHVTHLADRFAPYVKSIRQNIAATAELGDADTSDLYTEISRGIDKHLWFLEAHLQDSTFKTDRNATEQPVITN